MSKRSVASDRIVPAEGPTVYTLRGQGLLRVMSADIEGDFELTCLLHEGPFIEFVAREPSASVVKTAMLMDTAAQEDAELTGSTEAGEVHSRGLLFVNRRISPGIRFGIQPSREVRIGSPVPDGSAVSRTYHLTNYFGGDFSVRLGHVSLTCSGTSDTRHEDAAWVQRWRLPAETAELTSSVSCDRDIIDSEAHTLLVLLSFLEGHLVSYARCTTTADDGTSFETWRQTVTMPARAGYGIIYAAHMRSVLGEILPAFLLLPEHDRLRLRLAIAYLIECKASSCREMRTLNLATAWEILGDLLTGKGRKPVRDEVAQLKRELKACLRKWHQQYPTVDPDGHYTNRICQALDWDRFLVVMRESIEETGLSASKLRADLDAFKHVRDATVHTGEAPPQVSDSDYLELACRMAFAADAVILRYLGYTGRIKDRRDVGGYLREADLLDFASQTASGPDS